MINVEYYNDHFRKYTILFDGTFEVSFNLSEIEPIIDYAKEQMKQYGFKRASIRETETGNRVVFMEWESDEQ